MTDLDTALLRMMRDRGIPEPSVSWSEDRTILSATCKENGKDYSVDLKVLPTDTNERILQHLARPMIAALQNRPKTAKA